MIRSVVFRVGLLVALGSLLLAASGDAQTKRPKKVLPAPLPAETFVPKFAVMAETHLLMEGLANSNFRSLQRLLKDKPTDAETWKFVRGQSLLVAETGNLLLLRPPKKSGRETWMKLSMDMRTKAGGLARQAAAKDYDGAKKALTQLKASCNRCHQTFRVPVELDPVKEQDEADTE